MRLDGRPFTCSSVEGKSLHGLESGTSLGPFSSDGAASRVVKGDAEQMSIRAPVGGNAMRDRLTTVFRSV